MERGAANRQRSNIGSVHGGGKTPSGNVAAVRSLPLREGFFVIG